MTGISTSVLIWICVTVALVVAEIFTAGFFFMFFAVGAGVTALAALLVENVFLQLLIFTVSSALMVVFTRPILKKTFHVSEKPLKDSNADALIGKPVLVLEPVNHLGGRVKVIHTGEVWTAYLDEAITEVEQIQVDEQGVILLVNGAKLAIAPRKGG